MNKFLLKNIFVFLLLSVFLFAGTDGTIRGSVTDREGTPMVLSLIHI